MHRAPRNQLAAPPTRDTKAPAEISIVVNSPCPAVFVGRTSAAGVEPTVRFGSLNFNHQTSLPSSQSAVRFWAGAWPRVIGCPGLETVSLLCPCETGLLR